MLPVGIEIKHTGVNAMGATGSNETKDEPQRPPRISAFFMAALAVRKFQKLNFHSFEKSLTLQFDKQAAINELKLLSASDQHFFKRHAVKLAHYVRKFEMTSGDLSPKVVENMFLYVQDQLRKGYEDSDQTMLNFLCVALKFLTLNSEDGLNIQLSSIVQLLKTGQAKSQVKNTLVSLLVVCFKKETEKQESGVSAEVLNSIEHLPDLGAEASSLISSIAESVKSASFETEMKPARSMAKQKVTKSQQFISKTVQTVKFKRRVRTSEEADFHFVNLSDNMKNRHRITNNNAVSKELEEIAEQGSDRSMFRNTWNEVLHLYLLVSDGNILKDDDRNNYLPSKLFGLHYFTGAEFETGKLYSFFIERMCISIFLEVSKKQRLDDKTIEKLMKCITDFNCLVSLLKFGEYFVNTIANLIYRTYWEAKRLQSPDMAVKFFRKCMNETTEEYLDVVFRSTKVRRKSYDAAVVEKLVCDEINNLRRDAVRAVYNCAVRNKKEVLTKERLEKILACTQNEEDSPYADQTFVEYLFKLNELAETLDDFDYKDTFEKYIDLLKKTQMPSPTTLNGIFKFMIHQARDLQRSQELFSDENLTTLCNCLAQVEDEKKIEISEIINVLLEHESSKELSEQNLEKLVINCVQPNNINLLKSSLTSLLLTINKSRSISQYVLDKLMSLFHSLIHDEECACFIVFLLSRALCAEVPGTGIPYLEDSRYVELVSSKLLCDLSVTLNDDDEGEWVRFEKPSDDSHSSSKISLLAAKVIWRSVENKVALSSVTVDNLILTLVDDENEADKQTKIMVAKCLYGFTEYMSFPRNDHLNHLLDLINSPSPIYDVGIYVLTAYMNGCAKVALVPPPVPLDRIHLENISEFYVAHDLMLGTIDFGQKINESFFKILSCEARKNQKFYDKNIFMLFDSILYLNEKYVLCVLKILFVYTSVFVVPEATIEAVENVLSVPSYSKKALQVLENVILAGKSSVTSKTLGVFTDCLQSSTNSRLRHDSFKLLEQASKNQELPDRIFHQLELVKAGYALQRLHPSDCKQMIIDFIQKLVDKGVHLPIDTQEALKKEALHERVLKVWATTAKNKQLIDLYLMSILSKSFKPLDAGARSVNVFSLAIFEFAVKNNQDLPLDLMIKLEDAFYTKDLAENVLPIFIYLTQKGEHLSRSVNDKLLDKLMVEEDPTQKQELLSSLGSLIQANSENIDFYQSKINTILTKEITSNNQSIQRLCVNSITKLVRASKVVDDELLDKLVEVGTSSNSNKALKCEILWLFNSVFQESHNKSIRKKKKIVQLANLKFTSQEELLEQLRAFVDLKEGLLPQNYHQLKDILESESVSLQEKTLDLLHVCCCKIGMTDELLNSVAILYQRTTAENVRKSCLRLLAEAVENGKTLTGTAMEIHSCASGRDNFQKFSISRVGDELRRRLGEPTVEELFQLIQNNNHHSSVETLSDFIYLVTGENPDIPNEGSFVLLIEMCLLQSKSLDIALPCYCQIVKDVRKCNPKCLDAVVLYYMEGIILKQPLQATLFELLYYASKCSTLSDVCMSFVLKNIESGCYLTRGYAFGILRAAAVKEPKYESILINRCESLRRKLLQTFGVDIGNFEDMHDLLEVIVSLEFLNVAILVKKGYAWKRELLISDIFEGLQASSLEKMYFYKNWCVVEKKFTYHESCKILSLIQKCYFDSFSKLLDLTCMILGFKLDELERLLTVHAPNPFQAVKQKWTMTQLQARVPKDVSIKYSSVLAEKLCHSFDVKFIDKLFRSLKSIDSVCAFEDLMSFCVNEKIDLSIASEKESKLDDLRNSIEANHACRSAKSQPSESEQKDFLRYFVQLKDSQWSFLQLHELVRLFRPSKFSNLLSFLKTLLMYKLPSSYHEEIKSHVLEDSPTFSEIMPKLNKLITQHHSQLVGKEKNLNELLTELEKLNPSDENVKHLIRSESLNIQKHVFEKHADKLNWSEEQIRAWVEEVGERGRKFENDEAIAVAYRGNFLITGHRLTHTQILCCLVALREGNLTGKLLQVATGEGKSTIICVLAIIIALRGTQVDVVTSSPVLAERDAKQKAKFYRMFGLSCSDNSDRTIYLKGRKDCYLADVVYGEMSQFQFDILRDNYSKLGTLGGRKSMTAIIDEVDNMLIDDSSKVARLSSTVPGMDHLQAIYVFIWQHMLSVLQKLKVFDNKMYFVSGNVGFENDKITLEVADGENVRKYTDLEAYLAEEGDKEFFDEVIDSVDEYLRRKVEQNLNDRLKANQIYIPSNLKNFVTKQKVKWVQSALEALNYQENVHYIIRNGEIMPVDYDSTGIVQSSTSWSNGLHQFLQLKHHLKMTCETVTTNFLSNVGFIGRYRQIYGLTGTLGSEAARSVLKDVYKVDLVNIPPRREKQFVELESIIEKSESDWLGEILSNVILEVQKNRGILVVCETIMHANRISGILKRKLRPSSVKLYVMNDVDQDKHVEKIVPGEVIIATNLAGRGTDIQTDEIEATGGLHVILTFLPPNQRVEDQAFGRTARQGKRGTGIMILNAHNLITDGTATDVKIKRDKIESEQLNKFICNELKLIQVKDKLFNRFCNFLNCEIRLKIREKVGVLRTIKSSFTDTLPTTEETCILAAVEEQWASFLSKLDEQEIRCEDAEKEYNMLCDRLKEDFSKKNIIKNPFYCITIANDISVDASSKFKLAVASWEFKQALTYFQKAIEIEMEYWRKEAEKQSSIGKDDLASFSPGAAHVGVAWCLIHLKEGDYKQEALIALQTAFKCLLNEMSVLNCVQLLLQQSQNGFPNSDLDKQLNIKSSILGSYIRGIEGCIDAIKRSKRLIDVVAFRKGNENDRFVETSSHFKDQEKNEVQAIVTKKLDPRSRVRFLLAFKHLTKRNDCGTIDQALETLHNVYRKMESSKGDCCLSADSYVRINIQSNLANLWSALFNPHKNYKDLVRETAIAKLKEERSSVHKLRLGESPSTQLIIRSNGESKLNYEDKQINEVIKIIEEQEPSDNALRFDIIIKDANVNEINKFFRRNGAEKKGTGNNLPKSKSSESPAEGIRISDQIEFKLNVTLENVSQEIAKEKLKVVKARSFNIEFVLNKSALLELIETNEELEHGTLRRCDTEDFDKFAREELEKQVEKLKEDTAPCFIKFDNLSCEQAEKVIESCPGTVIFNIGFMDISHYFDGDLEEGQGNVCFDELNKNSAEVTINLLRDHGIDFSLEFCNLLDKNVCSILESASHDQEHINVIDVKNVKDLFMKNALPTQELHEFASKGIEFIIVMNEKKFIPWRSVCAVAALGVAQVAFGGILFMTGFGTSVGMGFITEGIVDMIYAYRTFSTREFQWSDYCAQKAVSLAISAVSMGVSKIMDATKGIKTLTTSVGTEMLEQSGTQIITQRKAVATTLKTARANLKSLPWENMGIKISKAVAKKALNTGVQYLSNFSFYSLKPELCESVQSRVRRAFDDPELKCLLYKMHAIDTATNSKQLQSRIEKITADILKQDAMVTLCDSIGRLVIQGVLSDSKFSGRTASLAMRIFATLNSLKQVSTLTGEVVERLKKKLTSVDNNSLTISLVLHHHLKISKENSEIISCDLKKLQIFDDCDKFSDDCDINEIIKRLSSSWNNDNCDHSFEKLASNHEPILNDLQKSIAFVKQFYGAFVRMKMESFNEIMKAVSQQICEQLIRASDSQLLQPWTTLAVSGDSVSSSIQHHHLINKKQNFEAQKADEKKYEELSKKDNLTKEEKTFLTSYGKYLKFVEQLN